MNRLVTDMLFLAQADSHSVVLAATPVDLATLAHEIAEYMELPAEERGMTFCISGHATVAGDPALEAKSAGDQAEALMKTLNIDWVTFEGERMVYCSEKPKQHFYLIKEAMIKKLRYNPEVRRVLLATGNLKLKPDHHAEGCKAPEWKYYDLWMEIRKDVMRGRILAPLMLQNSEPF